MLFIKKLVVKTVFFPVLQFKPNSSSIASVSKSDVVGLFNFIDISAVKEGCSPSKFFTFHHILLPSTEPVVLLYLK
jgi:hypothetical protein